MELSPYIPGAAVVAPVGKPSAALSAGASPKDAKLMDSCRQFEGQFFDMMLQEMRKTVPDDPTLGDDSHEQQIFQGMMDDNIAQQMAKHTGSNDLAAQMYRQLAAKTAASVSAMPQLAPTPGASAQPSLLSSKAIPSLKIPAITPENREEHDGHTAE